MIAMTPLEQATVAWSRSEPDEILRRQIRFDDARSLGEYHVFSNRNIALIVGLDPAVVGKITGKTDRTGGKLNPETLPLLLDAAKAWAYDRTILVSNLTAVVKLGTSWGMACRLTGIPRSSAQDKARRHAPKTWETFTQGEPS
jgi:hypothetical protein